MVSGEGAGFILRGLPHGFNHQTSAYFPRKEFALNRSCIEKTLISISGCADPWVGFESSCYLFPVTKETWRGAVDTCNKEGASLVSIKSQAEQDFVEDNMKGKSCLGMSDTENEGHWVWLADGTEHNYTHWSTGEPNGGKRENYGMIRENGGGWNDWNGVSKKLFYICKKSLE